MSDNSLENTGSAETVNDGIKPPSVEDNPPPLPPIGTYQINGLSASILPNKRVHVTFNVTSSDPQYTTNLLFAKFYGAISSNTGGLPPNNQALNTDGTFDLSTDNCSLGRWDLDIYHTTYGTVAVANGKLTKDKPQLSVHVEISQNNEQTLQADVDGFVVDLDQELLDVFITASFGSDWDIVRDGYYNVTFDNVPPGLYTITGSVTDLWGQTTTLSNEALFELITAINPLLNLRIGGARVAEDLLNPTIVTCTLSMSYHDPLIAPPNCTIEFRQNIRGSTSLPSSNDVFDYVTSSFSLGLVTAAIADSTKHVISNIATVVVGADYPTIDIIGVTIGPGKLVTVEGIARTIGGLKQVTITGVGLAIVAAIVHGTNTFSGSGVATTQGDFIVSVTDHWGRTATDNGKITIPKPDISLDAIWTSDNLINLSGQVNCVDAENATITFVGPVSVPGGQLTPRGDGFYVISVNEDHEIHGLETATVTDSWGQQATAYCQIDSAINKLNRNLSCSGSPKYKPNYTYDLEIDFHNRSNYYVRNTPYNIELKGVSIANGQTLNIPIYDNFRSPASSLSTLMQNMTAISIGKLYIIIGPITLGINLISFATVSNLYTVASVLLKPDIGLEVSAVSYIDGTDVKINGKIFVPYDGSGCLIVFSNAGSGSLSIKSDGSFSGNIPLDVNMGTLHCVAHDTWGQTIALDLDINVPQLSIEASVFYPTNTQAQIIGVAHSPFHQVPIPLSFTGAVSAIADSNANGTFNPIFNNPANGDVTITASDSGQTASCVVNIQLPRTAPVITISAIVLASHNVIVSGSVTTDSDISGMVVTLGGLFAGQFASINSDKTYNAVGTISSPGDITAVTTDQWDQQSNTASVHVDINSPITPTATITPYSFEADINSNRVEVPGELNVSGTGVPGTVTLINGGNSITGGTNGSGVFDLVLPHGSLGSAILKGVVTADGKIAIYEGTVTVPVDTNFTLNGAYNGTNTLTLSGNIGSTNPATITFSSPAFATFTHNANNDGSFNFTVNVGLLPSGATNLSGVFTDPWGRTVRNDTLFFA